MASPSSKQPGNESAPIKPSPPKVDRMEGSLKEVANGEPKKLDGGVNSNAGAKDPSLASSTVAGFLPEQKVSYVLSKEVGYYRKRKNKSF